MWQATNESGCGVVCIRDSNCCTGSGQSQVKFPEYLFRGAYQATSLDGTTDRYPRVLGRLVSYGTVTRMIRVA